MTENRQQEPKFYSAKEAQYFSFWQELRKKGIHWALVLALALSACGPISSENQSTPHPEAPSAPTPERTEDVNQEAALSINCAELLAVLINNIEFQINGDIIVLPPEEMPGYILNTLANMGLTRPAKIMTAMVGCFGEYRLVKEGTRLQFGKKDWKNLGHYPPEPKEQVKTPGIEQFEVLNPNPEWVFIPNLEINPNIVPTPQLVPLAPGAETQVIEQGDKYMILSITVATGTFILLVMFFPEGLLIAGPAMLSTNSGILAPALLPIQ